jgi:copper oxidase (laccase) domain-containing protein
LAARTQLRALGLANDAIDDVPATAEDPRGCTRCNRELFYSYRRDADASGRLIAVIVSREARSDL